jgi:membrane protein
MAASIAYHAFVSMLPILLLLTLAVSAFGSGRVVAGVVNLPRAFLPETGRRVLTAALRDATGGVGLSAAGGVVLLWGASKIFRAMDAAFAEIYDTERELSRLDQFRNALVALSALALAVVGVVSLGSFVRIPPTVPLAGVLNGVASVVGLGVAFFPIYYVFPNTDVTVGEVLPGVLVAAAGWTGLERLFDLYVSMSNMPDVYGLLGTLVLLATWLYVGSLVLLVGATVNATVAGRGRHRAVRTPEKRRFGRRVSDAETFESRLAEVVAEAEDAGLAAEEVERTLRRRATAVGERVPPREERTDGRRRPVARRRRRSWRR